LESGLGIHGEPRLAESHVHHDFPTHQFEIIREVTKVPSEKQSGQQVKATVRHDFEEGIVKKNAVTRKPAAHNNIVALNGSVEKIAKFGQKMLKIAIY